MISAARGWGLDGLRVRIEGALAGAVELLRDPWGAEALVISAARGWGLDGLRARIEGALAEAASA